MKTRKRSRETRQCVIAAVLLLALPLAVRAWAPNSQDLEAAIRAGDFSGYYAKISAWLDRKTPDDADQISLATTKPLIKDPVFRKTLDQRQFIAKHGVDKISAFAKDKANREFLAWVLKDTKKMDLYLKGATPMRDKNREANTYTIGIAALERWKKLYADHPDSRDGVCLKLAIATALYNPQGQSGGKSYPGGKTVTWEGRYEHYEKAYENNELFPSFDDLLVCDIGKVLDSWASDEDLAWGREMVRTWRPDLLEKEQIPLMSSEVWRRFSPYGFTGFPAVLAGGGKCGPRAFFGAFICEAFGIPAIGIGQPGHACFAAKVAYPDMEPQPGSVWKVYQGRGWKYSDCGGAMYGPEFRAEMEKRYNVAEFSMVEHLRWLASALPSESRAEACREVARNIWKSMPPLNWDVRGLDCVFGSMPFNSEPTETCELKALEAPRNAGESYAARVRGFIHPPRTGEYVFSIASDDHSELFLSADENPDKKEHIAHVWGWTKVNNFKEKPSQKSDPVRLEAGKRYYIEVLHREMFTGPDHLSVAWSGPGIADRVIVAGKYLSPYPSGAKGKIVREVWHVVKKPEKKPEPKPEPPVETEPGVIHIEAESFNKQKAVRVYKCFKGGEQLNFPTRGPNWGTPPRVDYIVEAPKAGVYSLTMRIAAANKEQSIHVTVGKSGPVTVELPWTRGLWGTTEPVDIRLEKGKQTLTLTRPDSHRGVAVRWLELRPK